MTPSIPATAFSSLEWRDAVVRALVLRPGAESEASLANVDEAGASVLLIGLGEALVLLTWPDDVDALFSPEALIRDRVDRVMAAPGHDRTHVAIIGGGADARELCKRLQAERPRRFRSGFRRASFHHVGEDGTIWNGNGRLPILDSAVKAASRETPRLLDESEVERAHEAFSLLASQEQNAARALGGRRAPGTVALVAACFAMYLVELLWGGPEAPGTLYRMGATSPDAIKLGEWWRLITPAFLHASPMHIIVNGWSLWALGALIERLFGTSRVLVLYGFGGFVAGVASTVFAAGMSVGASGAIFGLFGGLFALAYRPSGILPPTMIGRLRRGIWPPLVANAFISMVPSVDWHAHLGGMVAGVALVGSGLLTRGLRPSAGPERHGVWRALAVIVVTIWFAAFAIGWSRTEPWDRSPGKFERVALTGTHLSIELPHALASTMRVDDEGNHHEMSFGSRVMTPIIVGIMTAPDADIATLSNEQLGAAMMDEAKHLHEDDFPRKSAPSLSQEADGPVVVFTDERADGLRRTTWLTAREGRIVRIDVYVPEGTPAEWIGVGHAIVSSLREERSPLSELHEQPG